MAAVYHWTVLQSWIAIIIALFAIAVFLNQLRLDRFQQRVDLLFRMEGIFFERLKAERAKAARGILEGNFTDAEPVLDQFETVAMLVNRKALDAGMVKHTFFYWMNNYFEACSAHIQRRQKEDPLYWKDLSRLVPQLRELDARQRGVSVSRPGTEQLNAFLVEELEETLHI
jgi:hypothetical protein